MFNMLGGSNLTPMLLLHQQLLTDLLATPSHDGIWTAHTTIGTVDASLPASRPQ